MVPLLLIVFWIIALILIAAFAGWLSLRNAKEFRYWSQHPWRVFWISYLPFLISAFLLNISGLRILGYFLLTCSILVIYMSAIQGLRVTWQRSHKRAVIILALVWALLVLQAVVKPQRARDLPELIGDIAGGVLSVPLFVFMAWFAEYVVRRLTVTQKAASSELATVEESASRLKKCPKCARNILKDATRCPFCWYVI